jgi:hypothetical protein
MRHPAFARRLILQALLVTITIVAPTLGAAEDAMTRSSYKDLVALFEDWREFERPPLREGAPDYTAATFARMHGDLKAFQARLAAIEPVGWPIEQQVDYQLLRAEMNGFDFNVRVLRPWARDPAFYASVWTAQSDTPAHEGPTHHGLAELWTYSFPLAPAAEAKLAGELLTIPPLLAQARLNLVGNARDLWVTGIGTMQQQVADLAALDQKTAGAGPQLKSAIREAREATSAFVAWLEQQAPSRTGPSGIGKENYTWQLRNVHLVPMSWEQEVGLLERELARAHASLRLEEQRNHALPPIAVVSSPEEYSGAQGHHEVLAPRARTSAVRTTGPTLRALGSTAQARNFFAMASHREPMTLFTHFYHWWDLAQMRESPHPSPLRRGSLLYNIWDSGRKAWRRREEFMLHAGLYDDSPRKREIVWIMLAQRAARGLASLYAHANQFDIQQAKAFQVKWTPRGWMRPDLDLLGFEQQLYLRQPGYGTSYVTGKYLLEALMKDRSNQLGDEFTLRGWFEK